MAVTIRFPSLSSNTYNEGPDGYFTFPTTLVENPPGSGLYDIPGYLLTDGDDLYSVPLDMLGQAETSTSNLKTFSVQEDATPIDPSSSSGGVGQISVGMDDFEDAQRLIGQVVLADGSRGKTSGNVRTLNAADGALTLTADSVLGMFNTDRVVSPFVGTFKDAIQYYCDLVNIQNDVIVDSTLASRSVRYPGFTGNVWVSIKQILSKEQVEMALVFDRVYVRPLRLLVADQNRSVSKGWTVDNSNAARSVDVYYYNHGYGTQREVYPVPGTEASIYNVGPGETVVFTEQLNASLFSVNQPVVQNFVANSTFSGTNGVYSVAGNDGKPITAAQWTAQGGSVKVRITDDPSIIEITIVGANASLPAPFRIGMTSGSSNFYNSLHITGTAVTWNKKLVNLRTGVPEDETSTEVGVTVDNPFISTYAQALSLGMRTAGAYAGLNYNVTGTALDINRTNEGRDLIQATIEDFNIEYLPGTTISTFNTVWAGKTIEDFNEFWDNKVDLLWENQLFGNAPGARVLNPDANFRINSATTTESAVQYTASLDTLVGDFNDAWPEGGTSTVYTNRATNPSMEAASGTVEVRRNLVLNPNSASTVVGVSGYGTGGAGSNALTAGAGAGGTYANVQTWSTPGTAGGSAAYIASSSGSSLVPVTAATVISVAVTMKVNQSGLTGAVTVDYFTSGGAAVGTSVTGTIVSLTSGVETQVSALNLTVPATAARIRIAGRIINLAGTTAGLTNTVSQPIVEIQPVIGPYFDGAFQASPDSDLTASWTGTANNSASILSAPAVVGSASAFPERARRFQSTQWISSGTKSLRVTPYTNNSYGEIALVGLTIGATYSVIYKRRTTVVLTGTPNATYAGRFDIVSPNATSVTMTQSAPNTIGVYEVRGTFVAASTTHSIRLGHGYSAGDAWFDDLAVIEGAYTDGYFSGATSDTHADGITTDFAWTGTANASTSTKTVYTNQFWIEDFNTQFAGMTIKDYNVIPLRRT